MEAKKTAEQSELAKAAQRRITYEKIVEKTRQEIIERSPAWGLGGKMLDVDELTNKITNDFSKKPSLSLSTLTQFIDERVKEDMILMLGGKGTYESRMEKIKEINNAAARLAKDIFSGVDSSKSLFFKSFQTEFFKNASPNFIDMVERQKKELIPIEDGLLAYVYKQTDAILILDQISSKLKEHVKSA